MSLCMQWYTHDVHNCNFYDMPDQYIGPDGASYDFFLYRSESEPVHQYLGNRVLQWCRALLCCLTEAPTTTTHKPRSRSTGPSRRSVD